MTQRKSFQPADSFFDPREAKGPRSFVSKRDVRRAALDAVVSVLTKEQRAKVAEHLATLSEVTTSKHGSHWQDPARRAETQRRMKEAWAERRSAAVFVATWRSGREEELHGYDAVAKLLGVKPSTIQAYFSAGPIQRVIDDDIVTVKRVKGVKLSASPSVGTPAMRPRKDGARRQMERAGIEPEQVMRYGFTPPSAPSKQAAASTRAKRPKAGARRRSR